MKPWVYALSTAVFFVSLSLTTMLKRAATAGRLMDIPNERSSHAVPTPRGGGLAIVMSSVAAMGVLVAAGAMSIRLFVALGGGGLAVAAVGYLDDYYSLSARMRLLVHFAAAAWAVFWAGHVSILQVGGVAIRLGLLGYLLSAIAIVWFVNIYNFMDGIDGIAACEAIFVCGAAVMLTGYPGGADGIVGPATAIAGASVGFLVWNWSPARIFMGDVGSGYLGFVIGVLALANASASPSAVWTWLILAGVFVADSSVTLARRLVRGGRVSVAHRSHAYQIMARRSDHAAVTMFVVGINVVWLLPWAILSTVWQSDASLLTVAALSPLAAFAIYVGAGRRESSK